MKNDKQMSKLLSLLLRHSPETAHLNMDKEGWVSIDELCTNLRLYKGINIDIETIHYIVKTNDKQRFRISECGKKIRANQGHSVSVNLGFEAKVPPEILYHGTTERFVSSIMGNGIKAMSRQYVHLSSTEETAITVGRRRGKPVVLKVDTRKMCEDGYKFYLSENKVWLTDFVPKEYINKEQIVWYV